MVESATTQLVRWHKGGADRLRMSVNLSPNRFREPELATRLHDIVLRCGLEPSFVQLELTESSALPYTEETFDTTRHSDTCAHCRSTSSRSTVRSSRPSTPTAAIRP